MKDYFALTQIFIDINKFGTCNAQPLSGKAYYKAFKTERSKNSILPFLSSDDLSLCSEYSDHILWIEVLNCCFAFFM